MDTTFLFRLHTFFSGSSHGLTHKIVFAPGTAPMRKENSEIVDILFATDFESAYFVDPVYSVAGTDSPLAWDLASIKKIDPLCRVLQTDTMVHVDFLYNDVKRRALFIAGDATVPQFQPKEFTVFFSGKRIGVYPGVGLRGMPNEYLHEILTRLPVGGYVVPDRALLDDSVYFVLPFSELGLQEVEGIREAIPRSAFPKGYSEDGRFITSNQAPGVGLYKKISVRGYVA